LKLAFKSTEIKTFFLRKRPLITNAISEVSALTKLNFTFNCMRAKDELIHSVSKLLARILPHTFLEKKLCKIDLRLVARDGDNPVVRAWKRIVNLYGRTTALSGRQQSNLIRNTSMAKQVFYSSIHTNHGK